jgi:hypothetical protein
VHKNTYQGDFLGILREGDGQDPARVNNMYGHVRHFVFVCLFWQPCAMDPDFVSRGDVCQSKEGQVGDRSHRPRQEWVVPEEWEIGDLFLGYFAWRYATMVQTDVCMYSRSNMVRGDEKIIAKSQG